MNWFRKRQYEEPTLQLTLQVGGWERVRVPKECKHKYCLSCDGLSDFAYCTSCGLRSPSVPHENNAWAETLFKEAEGEGALFRDVSNLRKIYIMDSASKRISPILAYVYGESKKRRRKETLYHASQS